MKLQTQEKTARPDRETKKANGEYNVKYTSYRYTQPKYMNGMIAPAMLSAFSGQLLSDYFNTTTVSQTVSLCVFGFAFASVIFILSYMIVLRPSMLDGAIKLAFHSNRLRALPLGFVSWTGVWMFVLNFKGIFTFLKTSYLNDILIMVLPMSVFLSVFYVANYLTLMVGRRGISAIRIPKRSSTCSFYTPREREKDAASSPSSTFGIVHGKSYDDYVKPQKPPEAPVKPEEETPKLTPPKRTIPPRQQDMPGVVRKRPR